MYLLLVEESHAARAHVKDQGRGQGQRTRQERRRFRARSGRRDEGMAAKMSGFLARLRGFDPRKCDIGPDPVR
jgi:hypothetical protein